MVVVHEDEHTIAFDIVVYMSAHYIVEGIDISVYTSFVGVEKTLYCTT